MVSVPRARKAHLETELARFGAVLRIARLEQERTLLDVALLAGIAPSHLSRIERGESEMGAFGALRLCMVLGVQLQMILESAINDKEWERS